MNIASIFTKIKQYEAGLNDKHIRKYAIMIPLLEIEGKTHLLFEVRSMHLRHQPGDICFPGGKIDKSDPDEKYSAIRETKEELNLLENNIHNVHPLTVMTLPPDREIHTFVGEIKADSISPNKSEVEEVFTVPLDFFLQTKPNTYEVSLKAIPEESFPFHLIVNGKNYNWSTGKVNQHFYEYEDKVIWGLTAKIILNFIKLLQAKD